MDDLGGTTIFGNIHMVNILLFTGFHTCSVVQDFFHQQYVSVLFCLHTWLHASSNNRVSKGNKHQHPNGKKYIEQTLHAKNLRHTRLLPFCSQLLDPSPPECAKEHNQRTSTLGPGTMLSSARLEQTVNKMS